MRTTSQMFLYTYAQGQDWIHGIYASYGNRLPWEIIRFRWQVKPGRDPFFLVC